MLKLLTTKQVEAYHNEGFTFPMRVFSPEEASTFRQKLEELERRLGGEVQARFRIKAHLPFPWLNDLIRHPRLLDAVEDVLGPNLLCWGSSFFTKDAHDPRFVSWHQDGTYYGLEPQDTLTVWVAFTKSKVMSGCMRAIPQSHHKGPFVHQETYAKDNLLSRGQTIEDVDESTAVDVELEPGEVSFHSETVVHGSNSNRSDDRRIGFSIHYIAPHVRQTRIDGATAAVVRGLDTQGHWTPELTARQDFDPACFAALEREDAQYKKNPQPGGAEG
jgi:non-haem Fe2+, alpha-ketoglutarate-dependent halogenase